MGTKSNHRYVWALLFIVGVLSCPAVLDAQVISNPETVKFLASPTHFKKHADGTALLTRYELALFRSGEETAFAQLSLGKPAPASDGSIEVEFRSRLTSAPPTDVPCVAVILAIGPGGSTASEPSNEFVFQPLDWSTRGDVDGDGDADLALFRYRDATWIVNGSDPVTFGRIADIPIPANYDGAFGDEYAVFRPATAQWLIEGRGAETWGQVGDIPVPGDYDGDGDADLALFRPSTGYWIVQGQAEEQWGTTGDIPVPGDYDGDGRTDLAVFRPTTRVWYIKGMTSFAYGNIGDVPVPADYNGDGTTDIAVFRRSNATWYVRGQFSVAYGAAYDMPVPQDLNGDGRAELVVWRPTISRWYARFGTTTARSVSMALGGPGDLPVLAPAWMARSVAFDADGDRRADPGVYRRSNLTWYMLRSTTNFASGAQWNLGLSSTDRPAPGDYDGDRFMDAAVCSGSTCRIGFSSNASAVIDVENSDAAGLPVPGDYDGDGRTDLATFVTGRWRVFRSSDEFDSSTDRMFGISGDVPVPGDYNGDGLTDFAVYRKSNRTWYVGFNPTGMISKVRGGSGDIPFARDVDGDGRADMVFFSPSTFKWTVYTAVSNWGTALPVVVHGQSGDIPVPADYNGDGKAEFAVFRPSTGYWYIRAVTTKRWGTRTDIPIER